MGETSHCERRSDNSNISRLDRFLTSLKIKLIFISISYNLKNVILAYTRKINLGNWSGIEDGEYDRQP